MRKNKFMRNTIFFRVLAVGLFAVVMLACNGKSNAQSQATVNDKPQIYGIKSGYYKSELPLSESIAETWFDDYGNLQYVEIQTIGDPIKSYKLVRDSVEYYYSDYNKMGLKKTVDYMDYRKWESPSVKDLEAMGMKRMPTQMIMGKACKTYFVQDHISTMMSFWKGILMAKIFDDGSVISEVVDLRETAVPSNMFDIPQDITFEEETEQPATAE